MKNTNVCLEKYICQGDLQNVAVRVGIRDKVIADIFKSVNIKIDEKTLFDMASVTKIMATTMICLIAYDKKLLDIEDKVSKFFDVPEDKKEMTIKHLLTHTMGIGHKSMVKNGNSYNNISHFILNMPSDVPIGSETLYSCPGYILLGKILEKVFGQRLDKMFTELVAKPLGMGYTTFLPSENNKFVNSNLSLDDIGIVNDYNCRFLCGVAGNAGLFSCIEDVSKYVKMLLNFGEPLIDKNTFETAIKNYTKGMTESRGLGFVYVDEKYCQTGELFPEGSIGHCGHTGQSVFVDLKKGLYVIILSDATISTEKKYGEEKYDIVMKMREDIHNSIMKDLI